MQTIGQSDGSTRVEYHLKSGGSWVRLQAEPATLETMKPNTRVTATGRLSEDGYVLEVDTLEPANARGVVTQALSSSAPPGKVAIFLIKDTTMAGEPFSEQDVIDAVLSGSTSSNSYFRESSYGSYGLTGDVFGWYTADLSNCDARRTISEQVRQQAAAQDGFVSDSYRHAIYIIRRSGGDCGLAGEGTVGTPDGTGEVWSAVNDSGIIAHELGHNLGLYHANAYFCYDSVHERVPVSVNCDSIEYSDYYDGMSSSPHYFHFNSYSKALLGWLPPANQVRVTTPGRYTLVPQEMAASGVQSLLIPTPTTGEFLHVELRKQFGFDSEPRFDGAVLVRRVVEPGLAQRTNLIDMFPNGYVTDASMRVGQVFEDPLTGVAITLVSRGNDQAIVDVAFNGSSCSNGQKDSFETGIDCGNLCQPCGVGQGCASNFDCGEYACSAGTCVASDGGLTGHYYTTEDFQFPAYTRVDRALNFDWEIPPEGLPSDRFSVRWLGKVVAPQSATYTFVVDANDGVRLWVNNQPLIDRWYESSGQSSGTITLTGGQAYDIRLDYFEYTHSANIQLMWSTPTMPLDLIPPTALLPEGGGGCTLQSALDLGPRSTQATVPSNACVKISQYPSWWSYTSGLLTVQSGSGSFPVAASWTNSCNGAYGDISFTTPWQSQSAGNHAANCPALIQLKGNGAPLQITWW